MFSNYLLQHPLVGANGLKAWPHLLPVDNKGYIGPGSPAGGIQQWPMPGAMPLGSGQGYAGRPFAPPYKSGIGMVQGSGAWQSAPQPPVYGGQYGAVQHNTGLRSDSSGLRPFAVQHSYGGRQGAGLRRAMVRY